MSVPFDEATLAGPPPERSAGMRVNILTYEATDPENTPTALRGMARALVNGKLDLVYSTGATAEEARAKLSEFYDKEFARLGAAKTRGRPPKKTIEGPVGGARVAIADEIL